MAASAYALDIRKFPLPVCNDNDFADAINAGWVLTTAGMIFTMFLGLTMMEAGSVRRKNSSVVFYKYIICSFIAIFAFWAIGFAFAFANSAASFLGGGNYYFNREWTQCNPLTNTKDQYSFWCLQMFNALISLWLTLSMVSERVTMKAAFIYTFFHIFLIYPISVAWTWGLGWVANIGYGDYGGTAPVFLTGAYAGLAGLILIGTRYNRWNTYEDVYDERMMEVEMKGIRSIPVERQGDEGPYYPNVRSSREVSRQVTFINTARLRHRAFDEENDNFGIGNLSLFLIGFLLTWIGFYFFGMAQTWGLLKSGTTLWRNAAIAGVNIIIGAFSGGLVSLLLRTPIMYGPRAPRRLRYESIAAVRGALAGMTAVLSGASYYYPWASLIAAVFGGLFYVIAAKLIEAIKLDDPVETFATFAGGAGAGIMVNAFLIPIIGILYDNPTAGKIFGWQLLGNTIIPVWSFIIAFIIWMIIKVLRILRVDLRTEVVGYDFVEYADELDFTGKKLMVRKVEPAVGKKA